MNIKYRCEVLSSRTVQVISDLSENNEESATIRLSSLGSPTLSIHHMSLQTDSSSAWRPMTRISDPGSEVLANEMCCGILLPCEGSVTSVISIHRSVGHDTAHRPAII